MKINHHLLTILDITTLQLFLKASSNLSMGTFIMGGVHLKSGSFGEKNSNKSAMVKISLMNIKGTLYQMQRKGYPGYW